MDRRTWQATFHGAAELGMTEQLSLLRVSIFYCDTEVPLENKSKA